MEKEIPQCCKKDRGLREKNQETRTGIVIALNKYITVS